MDVSKWISVDERLPSMSSDYSHMSDNVLCCDKYGNIIVALYTTNHGGRWTDGEWFHIVTH